MWRKFRLQWEAFFCYPVPRRATFARWAAGRVAWRGRFVATEMLAAERLEDRTLLCTLVPSVFTDGQVGGSLREAVLITNLDTAVQTICLNAGTYTLSVAGRDEDLALAGDLDIRGNLVIQGAGSSQTVIDAASLDRVFDVHAGHTVEISGVTIRGGHARGLSAGGAIDDGHGGGIQNAGTLTLTDVVVSGNQSQDYFAYGFGGGISNTKSLTLNNSSVTGNQSFSRGGGIDSRGFGSTVEINNSLVSGNHNAWEGGGGIGNVDSSTLTVNSSTIATNTGGVGVGIYNFNATAHITDTTVDGNVGGGQGSGGGIYNNSVFTITRSTISNNVIPSGQLQPEGGGINNVGGTLTITNSTISGNQAIGVGGGGLNVRGGTVTVNNSTIANNSADFGGGVAGVVHLGTFRNTIVGNNSASSGNDIVGTVNADYSLIEDTSGATINGADNILGSDPAIGSLSNNGGVTLTHPLMPGSPALNRGDNTGVPATDQRGQNRIQGGVIDMGSFEAAGVADRIGAARQGRFFYLDGTGNGNWDRVVGGDTFRDFGINSLTNIATPIVGDWDGDGTDDLGLLNEGYTYLDTNGNGTWDGVAGGDTFRDFGIRSIRLTAVPVVGDWDGNGTDDLGLYNNGLYYLDGNGNGIWDRVVGGDTFRNFGIGSIVSTATPIVGDWDGDSSADLGLFNNNYFYLDTTGNGVWDSVAGGDTFRDFGLRSISSTALPIIGDWDGSGIDNLGLFNHDSYFYLDATGDGQWNTVAGGDTFHYYQYGTGGVPLAGNWGLPGGTSSLRANAFKADAPPANMHHRVGSQLPARMELSQRWKKELTMFDWSSGSQRARELLFAELGTVEELR